MRLEGKKGGLLGQPAAGPFAIRPGPGLHGRVKTPWPLKPTAFLWESVKVEQKKTKTHNGAAVFA